MTRQPTQFQTDYSESLRFLMDLLGGRLRGEALDARLRNLDWDAVLPLVDRHRVGPLAEYRLKGSVREGALPGRIRANAFAQLRQARAAREIVAALAADGIDSGLVKGASVAGLGYAEPALREAVDIDLLVRPEHFLQADAQMERLGYVRCYPDFALDPKAFSGLQRVEKSATYLRSGDGTQVDLHWRTARNPYLRPDFDRTWPDRVAAVAGGPWAGLPCPNPADTLSYVIVHGCHAGWVRLKWLADLHHLAESLPDALVAQSLDDLDKTGLLPLAASARSLCEATLGTEFSSVWDKALPTPASDRLLCLQEGFVADADVQPSNPWTRAVKKRRLQALRKALRQDADYRAHQTRIAVMTPWLRGRVGRGLVTALGRRL